jgi:aminoacyl tRNA synthase complex-interacting multifunctional protein 1
MRLRFQARLQPAQYHSYPSLSRYFDHIQSRPSVRKSAEALAPAFELVRLDFSTAPPIERKALETKKKEKSSKPAEKDAAPTSTPAAIDSGVTKKAGRSEGKPPKTKEKQGAAAEKAGKKTGADNDKATSAASEDAGPPIPSMIDLRVGHIVEGRCVCECLRYAISQLYQSKSTLMQTAFMSRQVAIALIPCRS